MYNTYSNYYSFTENYSDPTKYVYFVTIAGFNDMLVNLDYAIQYCKKYNRTLLFDCLNSLYKINFSDYFTLPNHHNVILDSTIIKNIITSTTLSVYPNVLQDKMIDVINGKITITNWKKNSYFYYYNNIELSIPDYIIDQDIIVFSGFGGGDSFPLFKQLQYSNEIKRICKKRYNKIENKPYLSLQIRNTDYKCDYKKLYEENKELLHSYHSIYIATDDKSVLDFFKSQKLSIINFTTFSLENNCISLHSCVTINGNTKIIDMLCDMYLLIRSDKLISNSKGGFINLIRKCFENKSEIIHLFT